MNILILTFYYPPDLSAGSFRAKAFAEALMNRVNRDDHIFIITTIPNRYHSYKFDVPETEENGNILIRRIQIPRHRSGMIDQIRSFITFYFKALKLSQLYKPDLIFATSSRLFTAYLGSRMAKKHKALLYIDIRDLFIDTIKSILPGLKHKLVMPFLKNIEKMTFQRADKINLVSEGFRNYIEAIVPGKTLSFYTNGIDDVFQRYLFEKQHVYPYRLITYAGNMGEGQGLEKIVVSMAGYLGSKYLIRLIGDGGTKNKIVTLIEEENITNIELIDPVSRDKLLEYYRETDYLFLHLNNYEAFGKVLPSKIFEYIASGKTIIAGVSGYAKEFIMQNTRDAVIFDPCNLASFIEAFTQFKRVENYDREKFLKKYDRGSIMSDMVSDFLSLKEYGQSTRK